VTVRTAENPKLGLEVVANQCSEKAKMVRLYPTGPVGWMPEKLFEARMREHVKKFPEDEKDYGKYAVAIGEKPNRLIADPAMRFNGRTFSSGKLEPNDDNTAAFINEPVPGTTANLVMVSSEPGAPLPFLAYVSAVAITKGVVPTMHYGDVYPRDYSVGEPAPGQFSPCFLGRGCFLELKLLFAVIS
jgi:hypothetical protein